LPDRAEFDVLIAGAGIVGASVAWHLATAGLSVAVVDATGPAAAASGASDGAVSVASKKPGLMARLASESLLYTRQLSKEGPLTGAFYARPSYVFGSGAVEMSALDALVAKLADLAGPVRVTADGSATLLPGVGDSVDRLVVLEGEGHMAGHKAVRAYLSHPGITAIWPAPIRAFAADSKGVTLDLGRRQLRGNILVAALGTSTPILFPGLSIQPRAGQLIVTDRGPADTLQGSLTAAAYLVAKTGSGDQLPLPPVVIDPLTTGQYLIGSTREPHGRTDQVDFAMLKSLLSRASQIWPALLNRRVIRAFAGVRAAVADGLPIVGAMPGQPRILMATGFEGDGICLSALVGREVALMVQGLASQSQWAADLAALSPARFENTAQKGAA
jgi:glycine/D-amino acid oxidase-like deaminating enzyme